MKHHPRGLLRGLLASALIALSTFTVSPALAELTGTVSGKVVDDTGQPLPGVSVTLSGPFLQGTRTVVTRTDGTYLVPNVPPGDKYKSVFALSGFTTAEKQGFAISVGNDTQVNATLRLTAVGAEVVVTGETPVVDITRTNTQASFDADYLRKATVGSTGRDYLNVLQHSPGVVGTGNTASMGSNSQQNSFTIDGINTTDPVTHTFS
ncbi:MAG: carboxypeptidase regulatory-like domain-containing protein [Acidobacteria bacterium]|nr:carboxypeptidase regulatory-like domain-containing protein [Acidobacteriota bacterium]